jgi:hypothetical protein
MSDQSPTAAPVAIVSEETARKYWPDQDAVGKHIKPAFVDTRLTIVGVVGDVNQSSLMSKLPGWADDAVYEPYGNASRLSTAHHRQQPIEMTLVVKFIGDRMSLTAALRSILSKLNADVPLSERLPSPLGVAALESRGDKFVA